MRWREGGEGMRGGRRERGREGEGVEGERYSTHGKYTYTHPSGL